MVWDVEYTDEFGQWWAELSQDEQESVAASVRLLEERGPTLGFPHSSGIHGSKHGHMRELRTQHDGHPLRTLYAFDRSGVTRQVTSAGTKRMCRLRIACMTNTWSSFARKG